MAGITRNAVIVALALLALSLASSTASAGGRHQSPTGASQREDTIRYWTPDRVANAVPRELFVDDQGRIVTQRPGGGAEKGKPGGGGGDGSTGAVTGAPWPGGSASGGLIQRTEGKVLFTMAGTDYVCSGTVVDDGGRQGYSLVLTAGHCVYDKDEGWATNWMFMPAFEDAPSSYDGSFDCDILTYGCWTADALVTSSGWGSGNFNDDFAFAVMGPGGHDSQTSLDDTVGGQAIAFSGVRPASVYAFGYPHASPYDGSDLIYCAGTTIADTWGGSTDAGLNCNMTGGSSGGGWLTGFDPETGAGTLVSLNSFKYLGGRYKNYMFGPLFDSDARDVYEAALLATSGGTQAP